MEQREQVPGGTETGSRWVEIDLDAVAHNTGKVKEFVGTSTELMAVVKANAYGLGAVEISRTVLHAGADSLGVSTAGEALELRENGVQCPILLLTPFLPEDVPLLVCYDIIPTVSSLSQIDLLEHAAREHHKKFPIHLEMETGMGRTGLLREETREAARKLAEGEELLLEGAYTHFADAGSAPGFTKKQFREFNRTLDLLDTAGGAFRRHVCNSAATLKYPEMHLDMVRVGTLLYGQFPPGTGFPDLDLRDPWEVKARILYIKEYPAGTSVGYGREERLKNAKQLAFVAMGHADGFSVAPLASLKTWKSFVKTVLKTVLDFLGIRPVLEKARIKGKKAPVVGRVGMQLTALDVTGISDVHPGDEVELPVRRINASSRLPRIYVRAGNVVSVTVSASRTHPARSFCED